MTASVVTLPADALSTAARRRRAGFRPFAAYSIFAVVALHGPLRMIADPLRDTGLRENMRCSRSLPREFQCCSSHRSGSQPGRPSPRLNKSHPRADEPGTTISHRSRRILNLLDRKQAGGPRGPPADRPRLPSLTDQAASAPKAWRMRRDQVHQRQARGSRRARGRVP